MRKSGFGRAASRWPPVLRPSLILGSRDRDSVVPAEDFRLGQMSHTGHLEQTSLCGHRPYYSPRQDGQANRAVSCASLEGDRMGWAI